MSRERAAQIAARRQDYDWLRDTGVSPAEAARGLVSTLIRSLDRVIREAGWAA